MYESAYVWGGSSEGRRGARVGVVVRRPKQHNNVCNLSCKHPHMAPDTCMAEKPPILQLGSPFRLDTINPLLPPINGPHCLEWLTLQPRDSQVSRLRHPKPSPPPQATLISPFRLDTAR